jgi:rhodanese-related sulfurtransferase
MMRNAFLLSAIALALSATVAVRAENIGILQATLAEADQRTAEVSTEQLRRILADGSAIVLDTRTRAEFDAGHIPGARNLDAPATEQIAAVERLVGGNKSAMLVLYCNGPFCQASRRLAEQLVAAGFTGVRRYQLGIPVWRALGGPTVIEIGGITRVFGVDRTAVFIDARSAGDFAKGSVAGAQNAPAEDVASGKLKVPLPEDDFNRRVILFGRDAAQARHLAELLGKRPWHNVSYFPGSFDLVRTALGDK